MTSRTDPVPTAPPSPLICGEGLNVEVRRGASPRSLARTRLFVVVACLVAAAFLVQVPLSLAIESGWDVPGGQRFWGVRSEDAVWTWMNVCVLAAAAAAHAGRAVAHRRGGDRRWWAWLLTTGMLAGLSLDDAVQVHERFRRLGSQLGGGSGFLYFEWVIPGVVVAAAIVVGFSFLYRSLDRTGRRLMIAGLFLFFFGALGVEAISGAILDRVGKGAAFLIAAHVEESFEALGATLLLALPLADMRGPQASIGWYLEKDVEDELRR